MNIFKLPGFVDRLNMDKRGNEKQNKTESKKTD